MPAQQVMTIIISLIKYSNFYTNLKKNRYPLLKIEIILLMFSKLHILLKLVLTDFVIRSRSRSRLDRLHNTAYPWGKNNRRKCPNNRIGQEGRRNNWYLVRLIRFGEQKYIKVSAVLWIQIHWKKYGAYFENFYLINLLFSNCTKIMAQRKFQCFGSVFNWIRIQPKISIRIQAIS